MTYSHQSMDKIRKIRPPTEFVERVETPVFTLDNVGGDLAEGGYDPLVVARLRTHSKTAIAATRVRRMMGETTLYDSVITQLYELDFKTRTKLVQQVLMVGDVPAEKITDFVKGGNELELKLAQQYGRSGGLIEITRFTLVKDLLELGPGESQATVRVEPDQSEKGNGRLRFVYGRAGESRASFPMPLGNYSTCDMSDAKAFFAELGADGHKVEACFGEGNVDFYIGLFGAAFTAVWTPKTNRMIFTKRPHSDRLRHYFGKHGLFLLDYQNGPFRALLSAMLKHYSEITVDANPPNHLAWLYKNMPPQVESIGNYDSLIKELRRCFNKEYYEVIATLECGFVEMYNCLTDDSNFIYRFIKSDVVNDLEALFNKAVAEFDFAREYRGSESGVGLGAFLNTQMKDVGVRPLGVVCAAYPAALRRYLPALRELASQKVKDVALYGAIDSVPLIRYAREHLGIEVKVYTTLSGTPFTMWNFVTDGRHRTDTAQAIIVDCFPTAPNVAGENVEVTKWNAHTLVMDVVHRVKAEIAIVFSRLISEKVAIKVYKPHIDRLLEYYAPFKGIGISYNGCRHHNGEFITWLCRKHPGPLDARPGGTIEFFDGSKPDEATLVATGVARAVCVRIILANSARTWAVPVGAWVCEPPPVELYGTVVDALGSDLELLKIRNADAIRKELSESNTQSTAATFGVVVNAHTNWKQLPAILARKRTVLPVKDEGPGEVVDELDRSLAAVEK